MSKLWIINCILVKNIWMDIITRWNRCCQSRDVIATVKLVTFGLYGSECNCEYAALNIIICFGKAYIWKTKQESVFCHCHSIRYTWKIS